jgi:hypothetical protein
MSEPQTSYPNRAAVEAAVRSQFADIANILGAAKASAELYPEGLPPHIDRALRFSSTMSSTLAPPEPPTAEQVVVRLCSAVDAERDRRAALDFSYDFGETAAFDDDGQGIAAGIRQLQMREADRANWQALQGAALTAVVSGQPDLVMPMRAEDNWNIQTTATQVLQVLAAMDPTSVNIMAGWPEQP